MQWNHREANRVFTGEKKKGKKKTTGEQIKLFMWHQMAAGKTDDVYFFFF